MNIERTELTADELRDTIRRIESDPLVSGLLVLTTALEELSPDDIDSIIDETTLPLFGGVFPQLLACGETVETGAVVVGLEREPTVSVIPGLDEPGKQYETFLDDGPLECGHDTGFVFVDAFADRIEAFIEALFRTYGTALNFVGGGAGTFEGEYEQCLFSNEGVHQDTAVFVTFDADSDVGVRHGWTEVAGPFRVTESNGTQLIELGGDRAFDVYQRVVEDDTGQELTRQNFFEVAKSYPFGISRLHDEQVVRDPYEVTDDGALNCFGNVPEGEFVHILRGDPDALIDAAGNAYDEATGGVEPSGDVLFFDCISRVLYLESAFDRELDAVGQSNDPVVGALTIGEVANGGTGNLEFYNKTAVVSIVDGL